jgi:hypothetical protein
VGLRRGTASCGLDGGGDRGFLGRVSLRERMRHNGDWVKSFGIDGREEMRYAEVRSEPGISSAEGEAQGKGRKMPWRSNSCYDRPC